MLLCGKVIGHCADNQILFGIVIWNVMVVQLQGSVPEVNDRITIKLMSTIWDELQLSDPL